MAPRIAPLAVGLALALAPAAARPAVVTTFSLAGGGELGLDQGKSGLVELEGTLGYEVGATGLRPEVGLALGAAPDDHVALRFGGRFTLPVFPIQLRAALDAATSRGGDLRWRWLLLGVGYELRLTSLLGFFGEFDTGAKLSSRYGVPFLLRGGMSLRF